MTLTGKPTVFICSVFGAFALSFTTFGSGVAVADNFAGQTYGDVSSALSKGGQTGVIASVVGEMKDQSACIVERSQKAPWVSGANFSPVSNTVLLYLNCNAALASPGVAGNSLASPEGRAEKQKEVAKEWKATTQDGAQWCTANEAAHPDWGAAAFDGCPSG